jgi:hypothetical protein
MSKTKSYYGVIEAADRCMLLGGVKVHRSSRFKTRKSAKTWMENSVQVNKDAGRYVGAWTVVESDQPPEIEE